MYVCVNSHQMLLWVVKLRGMRWARPVARMGNEKCVQKFSQKTEDKRPLGLPMRICENYIKMDLKEMWCEVLDWIHLTRK
jgi:hypothetical protein